MGGFNECTCAEHSEQCSIYKTLATAPKSKGSGKGGGKEGPEERQRGTERNIKKGRKGEEGTEEGREEMGGLLECRPCPLRVCSGLTFLFFPPPCNLLDSEEFCFHRPPPTVAMVMETWT